MDLKLFGETMAEQMGSCEGGFFLLLYYLVMIMPPTCETFKSKSLVRNGAFPVSVKIEFLPSYSHVLCVCSLPTRYLYLQLTCTTPGHM